MSERPAITSQVDQPIGIVLAGGLSSRMGTDKASLIFNGESLLLRARRNLIASGCSRVWMSGQPRAAWPDESINDDLVSCGPMAGILACINALLPQMPVNQTILFMPVDAPLLNAPVLKRLTDSVAHSDAAIYRDNPLPLAIRLTGNVALQIKDQEERLKAGYSCSINAFLKSLEMCILETTSIDSNALCNINTPEEWEALHE